MGKYDYYEQAVQQLSSVGTEILQKVDAAALANQSAKSNFSVDQNQMEEISRKKEQIHAVTDQYAEKVRGIQEDNNKNHLEHFDEAARDGQKNLFEELQTLPPMVRKALSNNHYDSLRSEEGKNLYKTLFTMESVSSFGILHQAMNEHVEADRKKQKLMGEMMDRFQSLRSIESQACTLAGNHYSEVMDYSGLDERIENNEKQIREHQEKLEKLESLLETMAVAQREADRSKTLGAFGDRDKEFGEKYKILSDKHTASVEEIHQKTQELERNKAETEREKEEEKKLKEQQLQQEEKLKILNPKLEEQKKLVQEYNGKKNTKDWNNEMAHHLKTALSTLNGYVQLMQEEELQFRENEKEIAEKQSALEKLDLEKKQLEQEKEEKEKTEAQLGKEIKSLEQEIENNRKQFDETKKKLDMQEESYKTQRENEQNTLKQLKEEQENLKKISEQVHSLAQNYKTGQELLLSDHEKFKKLVKPNYDHYMTDMGEKVKNTLNKFLDYRYDGRESRKNHTDKEDYVRMITTLIHATEKEPGEMRSALAEVKAKAAAYKRAKDAQWRPFPSAMRNARLAMAEGLIAYCDQMEEQYRTLDEIKKPVPLSKEEMDTLKKIAPMEKEGTIGIERAKQKLIPAMNKEAKEQKQLAEEDDLPEIPMENEKPAKENSRKEMTKPAAAAGMK